MRKKGKFTLQVKLSIAFVLVIAAIIGIASAGYTLSVRQLRRAAYERMQAQQGYYQDLFETQISQAIQQQRQLFSLRKLPFACLPESNIDVYEERDAVLSLQEWLRTIVQLSQLIDSCELFLPQSEYCITDSSIRRMDEEDYSRLDAYLAVQSDGLQYDGDNFYSVVTNKLVSTSKPTCVFVLTFSSDRVRNTLALFSPEGEVGAFIYNIDSDIMLAGNESELLARQLWSCLACGQEGPSTSAQRVRVGTTRYLVLTGVHSGAMGIFVLYVPEASVLGHIGRLWMYMTFFILVSALLALGFGVYIRRNLYRPLNVLISAFEKVKGGNLGQRIRHASNDEFSFLYEEFNGMEDRLQQLIEEVYVQKDLIQQAQIKQLQTQINPHFLYNSYFTLSRRIKRGDYDNAVEFCNYLGEYFKYITRNGADVVLLRQEFGHAKSYAAIQQARFMGRIRVEFADLPEEFSSIQVPRLILQPLLENAFGHGLENKVSGGILRVSCGTEGETFRLTVEDNGDDASDEVLRAIQQSLDAPQPAEITGIVNIHRRLKIFYHGRAGLDIRRSPLNGIAVSIVIRQWQTSATPDQEDTHEPKPVDCG